MKLNFLAEFAVFLDLELALTLRVHINLVPCRDVILILTDGTNQGHQFSCATFFRHTKGILSFLREMTKLVI